MTIRPKRSAPPTDVIARSSVGTGVVEAIKAQIANGDLGPGDRLPSQRALSVSMGVSLPTVREAIRSLTHMGLLDARQGSGTYVTSLSPGELMDSMRFAMSLPGRSMAELFDVRLMLEPAAARVAALRRTPHQLLTMRQCVEQSVAPDVDNERLLQLDLHLHRTVVEASQNSLLLQMMDGIAALGVESRVRTVDLPGIEPETINDHRRIVDAIGLRRATASERAMRSHIERIRDIATASGLPASIAIQSSQSGG